MLKVVQASQTETLLQALAKSIDGKRDGSPFQPINLVVPRSAVGQNLKLGLARFAGIAANIRVQGLDSLVEELASSNAPESVLVVNRLLRDDALLSILVDSELLEGDGLRPARDYLSAGGNHPALLDRRRAQLFHELSDLFHEYVLYRPELLHAWTSGTVVQDPGYSEAEIWQRQLWLAMVGSNGVLDKRLSENSFHGRASLPIELLMSIAPSKLILPSELYFFGFSYMPPATIRLLAHLAEACDVLICAHDIYGVAHFPERWGAPGREYVDLLRAAPNCEISAAHTSTAAQCRVEILSCPSIRRELEVIASEIWSNIAEDPSLRFNEIGVLFAAAKTESYQALVGSVFGETHDIPFTATGLPASRRSRVLEAIELLLELPLTRFTRRDILRFVTHPTVAAQFPEADVEAWKDWCDAVGIAYGADRRDHRDTYIDKDILNWDQGLKRLAFGAFMSGERSNDERLFAHGDHEYLVEELRPDETTGAARFGLFVRSLLKDLTFAATARMTLEGWAQFLATLVTTYLSTESESDQELLSRALRRVTDIGRMSLDRKKTRYRIPYELVRSNLEDIQDSSRHPLLEGVVVAPLVALAGIPFKVVFIAGLGEGEFPAADRRNRIDLREAERRPGDVGAHERDQYRFLQTVLNTQEHLYLSYVARDSLSGEQLQPSSMLVELRESLAQAQETQVRERTFPLARNEDVVTCKSSTAARMEARARELGREVRYVAGTSGETPSLSTLRRAVTSETWIGLTKLLGGIEPPDTAVTRSENRAVGVTLSAIRRFLECPLQGSARFALKMMDEYDEDDAAWLEEETFQIAPLDRARILRDTFWNSGPTLSQESLSQSLDEILLREEMKGRFPTGVFGISDRDAFREVLNQWQSGLRSLIDTGDADFRSYYIGAARDYAKVRIEYMDALRIEDLEISGATQPILDTPRGSLLLSTRAAASPKDLLKGFLDHVALSAMGLASEDGFATTVLTTKKGEAPETYRFDPIEPDVARQYLKTVATDLLSGVHHYLFPFETVMRLTPDHEGNVDPSKLSWTLRFLHENLRGTSSEYGPVRHPERALGPDDEDAKTIVRRRFSLLFQSLVQDE